MSGSGHDVLSPWVPDRPPRDGASIYLVYCIHRMEGVMPRAKMVYISSDAHRQLRLLAAQRDRPMGEVVATLIGQELADLANPWTGPDGLLLQEQMLAKVWDDPALDVYNDD